MIKRILTNVAMLSALAFVYVSIMGPCCEDCCGEPNYITECRANANGDPGHCVDGDCILGDPEPRKKRCAGKQPGDVCQVAEGLQGVCVEIDRVVSCLIIAEITTTIQECSDDNPCSGQPDGTPCTTAVGDAGTCQSESCVVD